MLVDDNPQGVGARRLVFIFIPRKNARFAEGNSLIACPISTDEEEYARFRCPRLPRVWSRTTPSRRCGGLSAKSAKCPRGAVIIITIHARREWGLLVSIEFYTVDAFGTCIAAACG